MITGEIKNVYIDSARGFIVVETEYKNGTEVVQVGKTRYTEDSGTIQEIAQKAKADIKAHCENLLKRIPQNETFIKNECLNIAPS